MQIPSLMFTEGGWCAELGTSYAPGYFQPKTAEEYKALAPFALDPPDLEVEAPKSIEDMKAGELIAFAEAEHLDIGGLVAQSGKEKILAAVKLAMEAKG